jgi:hypothetical protein
MKTLLKLTLAATLACALPVWACTPEEATAKREQLAKEVAKLTEQNPAKAKEINAELQKIDLGTASADLPDKCQLIDQRLKELDSAEKNRQLKAQIKRSQPSAKPYTRPCRSCRRLRSLI